mmetsp:Transcript_61801/g.110046  ORF Transcript_61801/g.110046 Transcript_61801/m.110046 type:complete len:94 (-) Transcript_61801:286-567(-)
MACQTTRKILAYHHQYQYINIITSISIFRSLTQKSTLATMYMAAVQQCLSRRALPASPHTERVDHMGFAFVRDIYLYPLLTATSLNFSYGMSP